jgi:hypothetical protein
LAKHYEPPVPPIHEFLKDLDRLWDLPVDGKVRLHLIGSTALMLQANYLRGTKDTDVLETADMTAGTRARLELLAGPGTRLHRSHRTYLEVVGGGLPFLPQAPQWIGVVELNQHLSRLHVDVLSVVDVVVSKLKRFSAGDQEDVRAMIELGLVPHDHLLERFRSAVSAYELDARAGRDLPRCVANLHRAERDLLGTRETEISLPASIDE